MSLRAVPVLTELQARVIGVLVEKERTVPDTYPLTLNALTAGCNQKTSRDPVLNATDAEVQAAIDVLRRIDLIFESSGGRVMRYSQNLRRVLDLASEKAALLVTLMLRGPQTAAELRLNCERLHRFSDVSSVEAYLDELAGRPAGALVRLMPRQAGAREARWVHLLCGEPALPAAAERRSEPGYPSSASAAARDAAVAENHDDQSDLQGRISALEDRVESLQAEVTGLRDTLARVMREVGLA